MSDVDLASSEITVAHGAYLDRRGTVRELEDSGERLIVMRPVILVLAMAVLGACGSPEGAAEGPGSAPGAVSDDPGSLAPVGDFVVVGGESYGVTCAEPAEVQLGASVVLDEPDARFDGGVEIVDQDPANVIALRADGRLERCPSARWVLGFNGPAVTDERTALTYAQLRCEVPATPDLPLCDEGGPFWYGTDATVDGTEGDGRSAVWIDGVVPTPEWRLDPLEVVAREVDSTVSDYAQLRRIGLRVVDERPDELLIEVLYQNINDNNGQPLAGQQREHHTLRRLSGREGWYPTEYIVAQYSDADTDQADLDTTWASGLDRVLVDVDRR